MWPAPIMSFSSVPTPQLWAIMLRNASDVFIQQISQRKFVEALEDVLTSPRTVPVVRERLMEVLAAAAFITSSRKLFVHLQGPDTLNINLIRIPVAGKRQGQGRLPRPLVSFKACRQARRRGSVRYRRRNVQSPGCLYPTSTFSIFS